MTEDEAKTKWCPFVRLHVEGKAPTFTVAPNREQRGTKCIASERDLTGNGKWTSVGGYCGLAGSPQ